MFKALDSTSHFIRSIVSLALVTLAGIGGWVGYNTYYAHELELKDRDAKLAASLEEIDRLNQDVAAKQKEIERLDMAVRLLKHDRRVAQIDHVVKRTSNGPSRVQTDFTFVEVDEEGRPLEAPRRFTIEGDEVHVDALVVKFLDEHVEQGDPLRGATMFLFRRIHGGAQAPDDAFPLDSVGGRPAAYARGTGMSETEKEIWANFWEYALDGEKAQAAGVRAAHGQTNYTRLMEGKRYKVTLRASDGLTIIAEDAQPPVKNPL
jgi:hypothetical protein